MTHFLMVYDKPRGELLAVEEFDDSREALSARFKRERQHGSQGDVEVVVLSADSIDDLRRTHGRYFKQAQDLADAMMTE